MTTGTTSRTAHLLAPMNEGEDVGPGQPGTAGDQSPALGRPGLLPRLLSRSLAVGADHAAPADRDTNPCRARQGLRNRPSRTLAPAENCRGAAPPAGAVTGTGCATRCPSGTTGVLDGPGGPWCLPPVCPVPPRPVPPRQAPAGAHLAERRHVVL